MHESSESILEEKTHSTEMENEWETIPMGQMLQKIDEAYNNQQYVIINDKLGNVPVFFRYKTKLFELGPLATKLAMGSISEDNLVDDLRHHFAVAWNFGEALGIDCGKAMVLFDKWADSKIFPTGLFFDWTHSRDDDVQKEYVKHKEMVDRMGDKRNFWWCDAKFHVVIISQSEREIDELVNAVPHHAKFKKIVIEWIIMHFSMCRFCGEWIFEMVWFFIFN